MLSLFSLSAFHQETPPLESARVVIHNDQPGVSVSPTLYGVFFEEINHAGDGGLSAELLQNRRFTAQSFSSGPPPGWSFHSTDGAVGRLDTTPASIRLEVPATGGQAEARNEGYFGIAVKAGQTLELRADFESGPALKAKLVDPKGNAIAEASLGAGKKVGAVYKLRPQSDCVSAALVLSIDKPGKARVSYASLMPSDTYRGEGSGFRKDLATMVEQIKPSFVRFPGGCYVEGGDKVADRFNWKESLLPADRRPGHPNKPWGYWSTDALGYHEYLQWCEDMHSAPLFVVNCGLAHHDVVPMGAMSQYVQDALDAIEYANGPVSSKWGALRAKNGHPKPFHLQFVEIGNENGNNWNGFGGTNAQYAERYKLVYDAIKARYPEIHTIADVRGPYPIEITDDHYYNSPSWFWNNVGLYDKAPRNGPKVYVGEYAVTSDCGLGNLRAGLAEAAFMTGLEKNSDVVKMASYAPLFVNVNNRGWNPDAIGFDGTRSFGTPSYWVQRLFSTNRPDTVFATDYPSLPAPSEPGTIGLGTWGTQAEYKDVVVEQDGREIYRSDFSNGSPNWKPAQGAWAVADGAYRQTDDQTNDRVLLDIPELANASDYTVHLKARKLSGNEGFLVLIRARSADQHVWWNVGGWGNTRDAVEKGSGEVVSNNHEDHIETGVWYDLKIEAKGDVIRCYLNDKLVNTAHDRGGPTLAVNAGVTTSGETIIKLVNRVDRPRRVSLEFAKQPGVVAYRITTLSSANDADENSLLDPDKVAPIAKDLHVGQLDSVDLLPYSLTIIRFRSSR